LTATLETDGGYYNCTAVITARLQSCRQFNVTQNPTDYHSLPQDYTSFLNIQLSRNVPFAKSANIVLADSRALCSLTNVPLNLWNRLMVPICVFRISGVLELLRS
jgi:hypothetical protein